MMRTSEAFAQFFYRVNADKTIDAICSYCFTESASAARKEDLETWQTAHRCSDWMKESA